MKSSIIGNKLVQHLTLIVLLGLGLEGNVFAQNEVIKIIVPFAAGGPGDQIARIIGAPLSQVTGKTVVIDNRGGAGGVIGVAAAAKAPADGNNLLLTTSSFVMTAATTPNLPYNPRKDFEPIYLLGEVQTVLAVKNSLGVSNLNELITKAKGSHKLNYGSTGVGGTMHIGAVLFGKAANVDIVHIPYKGAGPALTDLLAGTIDFVNADVPILKNLVKDGRIKAIVIYDTKRSPLLPDVPTSVEAGLPALQMSNWYGVLVPIATPMDAKKRLEEALGKVVRQPDIAAKLSEAGFITAKDMSGFKNKLDADFERWIPWLKEENIVAE
jgi:tripartite-type tricarboxylate transporter receptor subunit TctC